MPVPPRTRSFYIAHYVDANRSSPTFGERILGEVSPEGVTPEGMQLSRWARVEAPDIEAARQAFLAGEFAPIMSIDTEQLPAAYPPADPAE